MKNELNSERLKGPIPLGAEQPFGLAFEDLVAGMPLLTDVAGNATAIETPGVCPEPGEWLSLACGESSPEELNGLLTHAAECRDCAARLRLSVQCLTEGASPEETVELSRLESASPEWTLRLAAELARTPQQMRSRNFAPVYLWAGAALAASLVLAVGSETWWQRAHTPERLLAEAYSSSRLFELRVPGAGFAEINPGNHLRGGAGSHEPSTLLDARARIQRQLESAPDDAHWLQLQARADILEEKFDPAIDILDRLLAAGPVTPGLLVDDAAAYFERGTISGSESDRATALDNLRRADELAPDDPVVLFNEAIVMEDRGQMMNAVETWSRFVRFERDPRWQAEGRSRLQALQLKLDQLKSHQSRMEQHLASPRTMRLLAADGVTLAMIDEEFTSTLLPRLLGPAFALPVDRSRGSPCPESCQAARALLQALAVSLERNHQDKWLSRFLPSVSSPSNSNFLAGAEALGQAIDADASGDYLSALKSAEQSSNRFHQAGNIAGEERAEVERIYALQRSSRLKDCFQAADALLSPRDPLAAPDAWVQIQALTEKSVCDSRSGGANGENPDSTEADRLARAHHYALLDMRARNILSNAAVESGNVESAWRINLATVRLFYGGDYPAFRLYTSLAGLAEVEKQTPRLQLSLLLQRETMGALELTTSRKLIPSQRFDLAIAAIRSGQVPEALAELGRVRREVAASDPGKPILGFLADSEIAMANLYLGRGDLAGAATMLDSAHRHMDGLEATFDQRAYAATRGQLELAQGFPEKSELLLRTAILDEERKTRGAGVANIPFAREDRDLYAVLAGVWLAQGRSGNDILALWERFRLRALGEPVPVCPDQALNCLQPRLETALSGLGSDHLLGQVVLLDRLLRYQATAQGVSWTSVSIGREDLLGAAEPLERAVSSPRTSQGSVDQAARRIGDLLLGDQTHGPAGSGHLLLEPDPLLGNLPWPAVESATGPLGLRFDLEETPSLLLTARAPHAAPPSGSPLIVAASMAAGDNDPLPEVLAEAKAVARFGHNPTLLVSDQATEAHVLARLTDASVLHFAGHAVSQDGATRLLLAPALSSYRNGVEVADSPYLDSALLRKFPPRAAQLAVLSACSTGKKEEEWNHSMSDLVETLAALKVPEVVATRWQIDSAAAVPLMDAFYGGLANGRTVPQALTEARRSLVRDGRYRHPYYWAGSYASGSSRSDLRGIFHSQGE